MLLPHPKCSSFIGVREPALQKGRKGNNEREGQEKEGGGRKEREEREGREEGRKEGEERRRGGERKEGRKLRAQIGRRAIISLTFDL